MSSREGRYRNFFFFPHKGFRVMFTELLKEAGSVDFRNTKKVEALLKKVENAVYVYQEHNKEETEYFAPLIKDKSPEKYEQWVSDHKEHAETLRSFVGLTKEIIDAKEDKDKMKAVEVLYEKLCDYISGDLAHMAFEEKVIMNIFWDHFSDEELGKIESDFLKTMDPKFAMAGMEFLIRGHNNYGRIGLLSAMKVGMPPEVFQGVMDIVEKNVDDKEELEALKKAIA